VKTGYEPIARESSDFFQDSLSTSGDNGWMGDFLEQVGFDATNNFSANIRAYNNFTRQQENEDWAFTIFVVNNAKDDNVGDGLFASGGPVRQAFSYAGGQFMVVPSSRPEQTFAHEIGHQFWAIDEYAGGGSFNDSRGYYDTPNSNAANNPAFGTDEIQAIAKYVGLVNGGTFTLTINLSGGVAFTTAPIAYNANSGAIQGAINAAASSVVNGWTNGDISVASTVSSGTLLTQPMTLNYRGGSVDKQNHPPLVINGTNLMGGGSPGGVTQLRHGAVATAQQQNSIMGATSSSRQRRPTRLRRRSKSSRTPMTITRRRFPAWHRSAGRTRTPRLAAWRITASSTCWMCRSA
jgi:hypothetical protein